MHSGESERKSGSRFDSNWILTSQTVDLLITRSDDSSSKFDIEIQNRDKNAMVHSMEDCHSINSWHQDWSFDYKYTRDEVNSLLCKCFKICHTVMPEVRDVLKLREYFHNPLSDINLTRFIIVMSIYSTIFLVGVIGEFNFFWSGLYLYFLLNQLALSRIRYTCTINNNTNNIQNHHCSYLSTRSK